MRKTTKAIIAVSCAVIVLAVIILNRTVDIFDNPTPLDPGIVVDSVINYGDDDSCVIPDRYNTGAKGTLLPVGLGDFLNGIQFSVSGGEKNSLDFFYKNKTVSGEIVFENMDFSAYDLMSYSESKVTDRDIRLVFKNCKFGYVSVGIERGHFSYEFDNCSIMKFRGSNAVFNNCRFGDGNVDGLNIFTNVTVNNCFFGNMTDIPNYTKAAHIDGVQLFGDKDVEVSDIYFYNCRFEIPPIPVENSLATVNSCVMVQLEYGNASNVVFDRCIVNGGGYSIYAWKREPSLMLTNIQLKNFRVGAAKQFGTFYPVISDGIDFENITETETLYVSSVWKENGAVHIIVSNDTSIPRQLYVSTDKGTYTFDIPACPRGSELTYADCYDNMPFDVDITIDVDCEYVVCFDNTFSGAAKQIRFVNWTNDTVILPASEMSNLFGQEGSVLYSGSCGKNITYELSKSGVLRLSGNGSTYTYHSLNPQPWAEYHDLIRYVVVEEGITNLGGTLFGSCTALKSVELPDSLEVISKNAFAKCTGLTEVVIPRNVKQIDKGALPYATLKTIDCQVEDMSQMVIADESDFYSKLLLIEIEDTLINDNNDESYTVDKAVMSGECGKGLTFAFYEDGVLIISGNGAMESYHSLKFTPWNSVKDQITHVIINTGVTKVGDGAFTKYPNLESVVIADTVNSIGRNAFLSCPLLTEVTVPNSVLLICQRAFGNNPNLEIKYVGTSEEWGRITIESFNSVDKVSYLR